MLPQFQIFLMLVQILLWPFMQQYLFQYPLAAARFLQPVRYCLLQILQSALFQLYSLFHLLYCLSLCLQVLLAQLALLPYSLSQKPCLLQFHLLPFLPLALLLLFLQLESLLLFLLIGNQNRICAVAVHCKTCSIC